MRLTTGLGLVIVFIALGGVWQWWEWQNDLDIGSEVGFDQRLWQRPEQKWYGWRWKYQGEWITCQATSTSCQKLTRFELGDSVKLMGVVKEWEVQGEVVGKMIEVQKLEVLPHNNIWVSFLSNWMTALIHLRQRIVNMYQSYLPSPMAELLSGIVVGEQGELTEGFYEDLVRTGTIHVVAASGYNISVMAGAMIAMLVWVMKRKRAAVLAQMGIWSYVMLAGMSPPVVRAGIMGSLVFGAMSLGKEAEARWGLGLSMILMILMWPWMIADVSFQLSVAATAGILWGMRPVSQGIEWLATRLEGVIGNNKIQITSNKQGTTNNDQKTELVAGSLKGDLSTTLAATLATVPIIMVVFGRVSVVAPIVNVLVLWLVPPMMALGAMTAFVGLLWQPLGQLIAWMAYPLLWWFVMVVEWFSNLPFASVEFEGNWWVGVGLWVLLWVWWGRKSSKE